MFTKNPISLKNSTKIWSVLGILFLSILIQGCSKSQSDAISGGKTKVKINLSVGPSEEEIVAVGRSKQQQPVQPKIQYSSVSISPDVTMEVTLVREDQQDQQKSFAASKAANSSVSPASQEVNKALEPGVRYRVAVYDNAGAHIANYDYAYGKENPNDGIELEADQTYTFIAYSVNSVSELPNIIDQKHLSTAKLSQISGDLMFFKRTLKLTMGTNLLAVVLKHQFSQITTTLQMDKSMTGSIEVLTGVQISPSRAHADLSFSNETLQYADATKNVPVVFPAFDAGSRDVVSGNTMLISPKTVSANLSIAKLKLDGTEKSDLKIPNIKITPGSRYNLVLNFKVCTEDVTSNAMNWNYPERKWKEGFKWYTGIYKTDEGRYYKNNEVIRNTFSAPQANYGFLFDITRFDNALNMEINGQFIFGRSANDQVQFQTNSKLGTLRNIQFIDGTEYATNGIPEVFDMQGTAAAPLLRVLISRNGEVTLFGSKRNGGPLMELRLKNNAKFNNVRWNETGANQVVVTQKVDGATIIVGVGKGRKVVRCR